MTVHPILHRQLQGILARCQAVCDGVKHNILDQSRRYIKECHQQLQACFPADWEDFCCDSDTRDNRRITKEVTKNSRHHEIQGLADKLDKAIMEVGVAIKGWGSLGNMESDMKHAAERSRLYIAVTGALNLLVNKRMSNKYTEAQLREAADKYIRAAKAKDLWSPGTLGRMVLPAPIKAELSLLKGDEETPPILDVPPMAAILDA